MPLLLVMKAMPQVRSYAALRFIDSVIAGIVLLLSAPILAAVAVIIIVESGRPIFFSQVRLGRGGRRFRMHKFRKFRQSPGGPSAPLTLENDGRFTRVGAVLARTKLDELPQLWNILRGEMAVVGPRPESLAFQNCFAGHYRKLLDHIPGIFGPSQVMFRNEAALYRGRSNPERFYRDTLFPLKAEIDLAYFGRRTLRGDLYWMICGVLAVFGCIPGRVGAADLASAVEDQLRRSGSAPNAAPGLGLPAEGERSLAYGKAPAGATPGAKRSPLRTDGGSRVGVTVRIAASSGYPRPQPSESRI